MLKSVYVVYLQESADVLKGDMFSVAELPEYPSEEVLNQLLKEAPEGYNYVSVERSYTLA